MNRPSDLLLDCRSDQHCSRLGRSLNARGDVGRVAEHLAGVVDDDGTAFEADSDGELRSPSCGVSGVDLAQRLLDAEGSPNGPLGVILLRPRIARRRPSAHRQAF